MSKQLVGSNVFFIGIGGSSMSGLALLLKREGYNVSGSDMQSSVKTEHLCEQGINVMYGHSEDNIRSANAHTVVYTAAIPHDNPELCYAKENGIHLMKRSELVGLIMSRYKNAVGISGTKGKTTTTSLLSTVLLESGMDPSCLIGGTSKNLAANYRVGNGEVIVAESCEYQDSFLDFAPSVAVILNVELEHTDYFKSLDQLKQSFVDFAHITPKDGLVVGCADCNVTMDILSKVDRPKVTFGLINDADYTAKNITENGEGTLSLDVYKKGDFATHVDMPIYGKHNAYNVLATLAVTDFFGIPMDVAAEIIKKYKGTGRRFDYYGSVNGASVYDDYAHTPDEYRAVIDAAKNMKHNRVIGIFQPHTYSRSIDFFDETVEAFKACDEIIMLDIYAAREIDEGKIHSRDFANAMIERGMNAKYMPKYEDVADYIEQTAQDGDIVLVIGAGHSNRLCEMIAARGIPTTEAHGD